jgi:hypothetical protein
MQEDQRRAAKGPLIALMQEGYPWHKAAAMTGMQIGRSASNQLLRNVRLRREAALQDGQYGHRAKLRHQCGSFLRPRVVRLIIPRVMWYKLPCKNGSASWSALDISIGCGLS